MFKGQGWDVEGVIRKHGFAYLRRHERETGHQFYEASKVTYEGMIRGCRSGTYPALFQMHIRPQPRPCTKDLLAWAIRPLSVIAYTVVVGEIVVNNVSTHMEYMVQVSLAQR